MLRKSDDQTLFTGDEILSCRKDFDLKKLGLDPY
jgi:hypothetical protein